MANGTFSKMNTGIMDPNIMRLYDPQQFASNFGFMLPQIPVSQPMTGGMNQNVAMGQGAMTNQSGYPVPPSGYDNYNNPYWLDPATGQATYTPPNSGLGLGKMIQKGAAWAKWLA